MNFYLTLAGILYLFVSCWFLISFFLKRKDVADIAWGTGFIFLSLSSLFITGNLVPRSIIILTLIILWGLRLAIHIFLRNRGRKEDARYDTLSKSWNKFYYLRSYLQVFILQGALLYIISIPVLYIIKNSNGGIGFLDFVGILVWALGFCFETISDHQLLNFMKTKKEGQILQTGLWKYSRHPNYFGEITMWWGIFIICLNIQNSLLTIIGPLTISFLIIRVSGIPMLEKRMEKNPNFIEYKNKTSVFIPFPPKR